MHLPLPRSPSHSLPPLIHGSLTRSRCRRRHQGAIQQREWHGRRPQDQDAGPERGDPVLDHVPVGGGAPVARPNNLHSPVLGFVQRCLANTRGDSSSTPRSTSTSSSQSSPAASTPRSSPASPITATTTSTSPRRDPIHHLILIDDFTSSIEIPFETRRTRTGDFLPSEDAYEAIQHSMDQG